MPSSTRHLSPRQFRGLQKLGDVYAPGDEQLPSFSRLGCGEAIDQVLDVMDPADRSSLKLLLGLLAWCPANWIRGLARLLERSPEMRGPWGGPLRFLRMGVKGLVLTLYYSGERGGAYQGPTPLDVLEYRVSVYTGDLPS